jgi:hypothetical protein
MNSWVLTLETAIDLDEIKDGGKLCLKWASRP